MTGSSQISRTLGDNSLNSPINGMSSRAVTFTYGCPPGDDLIQSIYQRFDGSKEKALFIALESIAPEDTYEYYVFLDHAQPILPDLDSQRLVALQKLMAKAAGILWVTCGARAEVGCPKASMSAGWTRSLRREMANVKVVTLDISAQIMTTYEKAAGMICAVLQDGLLQEFPLYADKEFAEIDGVLKVPRLLHDADKDQYIMQQLSGRSQVLQPYKQASREFKVQISRPGLLQSIRFVDSAIASKSLGDDKVEIEVYATGMNFKDIMIGLGQIQHQELGFECSGIITRVGIDGQRSGLKPGDRVCAITDTCYSHRTRASYEGTIKIPDEMSFAVAASIPIVYCTAYHALFDVGRLSEGETVLIH